MASHRNGVLGIYVVFALIVVFMVQVSVESRFRWDSNIYYPFRRSMKPIDRIKIALLANILRNRVHYMKVDALKNPYELVFIIDSSKSVGDKNFTTMLGFVSLMMTDFTVDKDHVRVSVITYSSPSRVVTHINYLRPNMRKGADLRNKCTLQNDMKNIPYDGGQTYTLGGFVEAQVRYYIL